MKHQNDNFDNILDDVYAKGGDIFMNTATTISGMLGPGSGGLVNGVAGLASLYMDAGDFTYPIYDSPHRIYQLFVTQRLTDLIPTIRGEPATKFDPINIIVYPQGMIITMLASMLVKATGTDPADRVVLNHPPYTPERMAVESIMFGHYQTDRA